MATIEVEERDTAREPGLGLALLTVLGIIGMIAVLSALVWMLIVGVAATTGGRNEQGPAQVQTAPLMDQKPQPAKQP